MSPRLRRPGWVVCKARRCGDCDGVRKEENDGLGLCILLKKESQSYHERG